MSDLTPEQAAQRLLSLIETLGIHGNDNKTQNAKSRARKLDPSSISWAFHDSVDRSGVLKWIVENVDVSKNGITDDELELLDYLDRINYTSSSDSTSGGLGGELNQGAAADKVVYAFELKARKSALEARIDRLSKYKDVIRGQNAMLKDRVDDMSRKLAAYKAEEENLARLASASDSEVSRLTSIYAGVLEEASLAAKALMAKLDATSGSPSKAVHKNGIATKDEEARQFFYQNSGMVERLGINVQSYMENLSELVMAQIQQSNELPSPWKEFQPFETGSIAELLNLAKSEHGRIDRDVVSLAKTKASLEVQSDLVQAVTQEVDRIYEAGDLLSRCQLLTSSLTNDSTVSHSIDELAEAHARSLTEGALGNFSSASQLEQFKDALDKVNQGFNELAEHRNSQVAQSLIAATQNLEPQHQAAEAILDALAEEQQMLSGWNELWAAVADSLEKDNAETEGQRQALVAAAAAADADGASQGIHPDDLLALSLKQLLSMSKTLCRAQGTHAGSAADMPINNQASAQTPVPHSLFSTKLADAPRQGKNTTANGDAEMPEGSWLSEGTFTSWEALLSDAKSYRRRREQALGSVGSEIMVAESLEQRINGSLLDLKAALQGGDQYGGTEDVDVMPVGMRDSLGELKAQAGAMRKRVTRAAMLAEEPSKAVASDYAALFHHFYS